MAHCNLLFSKIFLQKQQKLAKTDHQLAQKVYRVLQILETDPKNLSLHSHKVSTKNFGTAWSSSVTGDIRIIWNYDSQNNLVIFIPTLGSHSGKDKVYK
ncbi:MAG: hypothetical protein WAV41_01020 [Microgenomates group bacterium]